jgi:guanine deaminase
MRRGEGGPFGALIVRQGKIISRGWNTVLKSGDPTRHAEMIAISRAARKLKRPFLSGCEIFSTTEPCPMCFSAIHWARLKRVTFATTISDVKRLGFNELSITSSTMRKLSRSPVRVIRNKSDDCVRLLKEWKKLPRKKVY